VDRDGGDHHDEGTGTMSWWEPLVPITAFLAGAMASVAGFGIGSLLTPLFAVQMETKLAVAAVSIPHAIGTALRFWLLQGTLDRRVFWSFGLMSAAGGLTGAALHRWATSRWLAIVFGLLLLFVALTQATSYSRKIRFHGIVAWTAGAVSGFLGGLVGNQGGIRAAALLGFDLPKHAFVATATAVGLVVDAARMPVYLALQGAELTRWWAAIVVASLGVIVGTLVGDRLLRWIPEIWFRSTIALILAMLGAAMLYRGAAG
jgi:uncharacterized membrane protein YfcA